MIEQFAASAKLHPLMKIALRPLYDLGIEEANDAVEWVRYYVSDRSDYYYTSKQGALWIRESWINKQKSVEKIFREIDQES